MIEISSAGLGASMLAGIGLTVSIFITGLAFSDASLVGEAKLRILAASAIMGARLRRAGGGLKDVHHRGVGSRARLIVRCSTS